MRDEYFMRWVAWLHKAGAACTGPSPTSRPTAVVYCCCCCCRGPYLHPTSADPFRACNICRPTSGARSLFLRTPSSLHSRRDTKFSCLTLPRSPFTDKMENKLILLVASMTLLLALVCHALPSGDSILEDSSISADKRPKYMDTRRDLDIFKYMLMASIKELVDEGRLNPAMLPNSEDGDDSETSAIEKRMQYMGICMRRRQNTLIPYPCLRSGRR